MRRDREPTEQVVCLWRRWVTASAGARDRVRRRVGAGRRGGTVGLSRAYAKPVERCDNDGVRAGEARDDGTVDTDACTTGCRVAVCGDDAHTDIGEGEQVEACDDNAVNEDGCLNGWSWRARRQRGAS